MLSNTEGKREVDKIWQYLYIGRGGKIAEKWER